LSLSFYAVKKVLESAPCSFIWKKILSKFQSNLFVREAPINDCDNIDSGENIDNEDNIELTKDQLTNCMQYLVCDMLHA
jgi:hypothetical protein